MGANKAEASPLLCLSGWSLEAYYGYRHVCVHVFVCYSFARFYTSVGVAPEAYGSCHVCVCVILSAQLLKTRC